MSNMMQSDIPAEILDDLNLPQIIRKMQNKSYTPCALDITGLTVAGIISEDGMRRFIRREIEDPPIKAMRQITDTVNAIAKGLGPAGLMALHNIQPMLKFRFYEDHWVGWNWGDKFGGTISADIINEGLKSADQYISQLGRECDS